MRFLLLVPLLTVGCGHKERDAPPKPSGGACDALALQATEARVIRDQASQQLGAAEKALAKAQQWDSKQVTPEQDGSGEFSGARERAFAYERTASALCTSGQLLDAGMLELAKRSMDASSLREVEGLVPHSTCQLKAAGTNEWSSQARDAVEFEDRLLQACYDKRGGTRPDFRLPPMLLPTE
jgi:hypothetical protein